MDLLDGLIRFASTLAPGFFARAWALLNLPIVQVTAGATTVIIGICLGALDFLRKRREKRVERAKEEQREKRERENAEAMKDLQKEVSEMRAQLDPTGAQVSPHGIAPIPREGVLNALTGYLSADDPRGDEVYELIKRGEYGKAAALSRKLAQEAQDGLTQMMATAQETQVTTARQWRAAAAIAYLNEPKDAIDAYERSLSLEPNHAEARTWLGMLYLRTGDLERAKMQFDEVIARAGQGGDRAMAATATAGLADTYLVRGDLDSAERLHRQALAALTEAGSLDAQADELLALSNLARLRGNLADADVLARNAEDIFQRLGYADGVANALTTRSAMYLEAEKFDEAGDCSARALALYRQLQSKEGQANCHLNLGVVAWRKNEFDLAEEHYRNALALFTELHAKDAQGMALLNIAEVQIERARHLDDPARAAKLLAESSALLTRASAMLNEVGASEPLKYVGALEALIDWRSDRREQAAARWKGLLRRTAEEGAGAVTNEITRILQREGVDPSTL